eukprot:1550458-Prymnesium_polylepis.1
MRGGWRCDRLRLLPLRVVGCRHGAHDPGGALPAAAHGGPHVPQREARRVDRLFPRAGRDVHRVRLQTAQAVLRRAA